MLLLADPILLLLLITFLSKFPLASVVAKFFTAAASKREQTTSAKSDFLLSFGTNSESVVHGYCLNDSFRITMMLDFRN